MADVHVRPGRPLVQQHPPVVQQQRPHLPVVQDLRADVHVLHAVLQVAHQQHVPRAVEVVVDALVVDGAQHGARLGALVTHAEDGADQALRGGREGGVRLGFGIWGLGAWVWGLGSRGLGLGSRV